MGDTYFNDFSVADKRRGVKISIIVRAAQMRMASSDSILEAFAVMNKLEFSSSF